MKPARARPGRSGESYLAAIYLLGEEGTPAIQARLADRLGHSAPTVSEMIKRLRAAGLVETEGNQLGLTPPGREMAETSIRRHRLVERLLTDVLGIDWTTAHREASRWEQAISDEVEAKLVALLGSPVTSSLGTPIPRAAAPAGPNGAYPLTNADPGRRVQVAWLSEALQADQETITYLAAQGLSPAATLTVQGRAPDASVTLRSPLSTFAVTPAVARQIHVTDAEATEKTPPHVDRRAGSK